jgi:hypothetical protein
VSGQWKDARGKKTGGSRAWRRTREAVIREAMLSPNGFVCCLCHQPIAIGYKYRHPLSVEVHHKAGGAAGLFDRRYLGVCHRGCNLAVGNPSPVLPGSTPYDPPGRSLDNWGVAYDPEPKPVTKW